MDQKAILKNRELAALKDLSADANFQGLSHNRFS